MISRIKNAKNKTLHVPENIFFTLELLFNEIASSQKFFNRMMQNFDENILTLQYENFNTYTLKFRTIFFLQYYRKTRDKNRKYDR